MQRLPQMRHGVPDERASARSHVHRPRRQNRHLSNRRAPQKNQVHLLSMQTRNQPNPMRFILRQQSNPLHMETPIKPWTKENEGLGFFDGCKSMVWEPYQTIERDVPTLGLLSYAEPYTGGVKRERNKGTESCQKKDSNRIGNNLHHFGSLRRGCGPNIYGNNKPREQHNLVFEHSDFQIKFTRMHCGRC